MTRINIVEVDTLTDQHLWAEWREIIRVPNCLQRTMNSKAGLVLSKISQYYKLNEGHVYHFYNKGLFLHKRFTRIVEELHNRGFNPNPEIKFNIEKFPIHLRKDHVYSDKEKRVSQERLDQRIASKPTFYKYYRKPLPRK